MTQMTRKQLAEFLRALAVEVESGDSVEGSLTYTYSMQPEIEVEVDGVVRTGNLNGQGGCRIL